MNTLTRDQADALVSECTTLEGLLDLQQHWIGHRDIAPGEKRGHVRAVLYEYITECAFAGDNERSNGPKGTDDTGLTQP